MIKYLYTNLRYRLILAVCIALLIPILLTTGYNAWQTRKILVDLAKSERLQVATTNADAVERALNDRVADIGFLALAPEIGQFLNSENSNTAPINRLFYNILSRYPDKYRQICLLDFSGQELACAYRNDNDVLIRPPHQLQNQAHQDYFNGVMSIIGIPGQQYTYISQPFHSIRFPVKLDEMFLHYATVLYTDTGVTAGTLVAEVPITPLVELLINDTDEEQTYLVDTQGHYLFQSSNLISENHTLHSLPTLFDHLPEDAPQILGQSQGTIFRSADRPDSLQVFARIRPQGQAAIQWTVIYDKPVDFLLVNTRQTEWVILTITAISLISAFALISITVSYIVHPLRDLASAAHTISQDNLHAPLPIITTEDEIGQLTQALSSMTIQLRTTINHLQTRVMQLEETQYELQQSETRFRSLVENSIDLIGIIHIPTLKIQYINNDNPYGYHPDELATTPKFYFACHPDDRLTLQKHLDHIQNDQQDLIEFRLHKKTGGWEWLQSRNVTLSRDENGVPVESLISVMTITERKQAEEQLKLLAQAVSNLADGIVITNSNLERPGPEIVFVNEAVTKITGYSADELIGQSPRLFQGAKTNRAILKDLKQKLQTRQMFQGEGVNYRKDGSEFQIRWNITPVNNDKDEITHYVSVMRDVTELFQLQARLTQAQKMEAIGQLAGGVAHDFNNILTVILAYSELMLRQPDLPPQIHKRMIAIKQAGESAAGLTQRLLAFGRRQTFQLQTLDLNQVIQNLDNMFSRLIRANIVINFQLADDLNTVKADHTQLEQVILNLVINARDAIIDGGKITIITENHHLTSTETSNLIDVMPGHYIKLTVRDTGIGIDKETCARIFEPFFTTKGLGKGTGLGLSTVHGIIKQLGGHISVDSELNQGSNFHIYLPATADAKPGTPAEFIPSIKDAHLLQSAVILIVEDDPEVRHSIADTLVDRVMTIYTANSGEEALEQFLGRTDIDILLTDMMMSGITGYELALRFRAKHPLLRIAFISGYAPDFQLNEQSELTDAIFVSKPPRLDVLLKNLQQLLVNEQPTA